jgi:hypothetical protein
MSKRTSSLMRFLPKRANHQGVDGEDGRSIRITLAGVTALPAKEILAVGQTNRIGVTIGRLQGDAGSVAVPHQGFMFLGVPDVLGYNVGVNTARKESCPVIHVALSRHAAEYLRVESLDVGITAGPIAGRRDHSCRRYSERRACHDRRGAGRMGVVRRRRSSGVGRGTFPRAGLNIPALATCVGGSRCLGCRNACRSSQPRGKQALLAVIARLGTEVCSPDQPDDHGQNDREPRFANTIHGVAPQKTENRVEEDQYS